MLPDTGSVTEKGVSAWHNTGFSSRLMVRAVVYGASVCAVNRQTSLFMSHSHFTLLTTLQGRQRRKVWLREGRDLFSQGRGTWPWQSNSLSPGHLTEFRIFHTHSWLANCCQGKSQLSLCRGIASEPACLMSQTALWP